MHFILAQLRGYAFYGQPSLTYGLRPVFWLSGHLFIYAFYSDKVIDYTAKHSLLLPNAGQEYNAECGI